MGVRVGRAGRDKTGRQGTYPPTITLAKMGVGNPPRQLKLKTMWVSIHPPADLRSERLVNYTIWLQISSHVDGRV